jgi:hypothetical protein
MQRYKDTYLYGPLSDDQSPGPYYLACIDGYDEDLPGHVILCAAAIEASFVEDNPGLGIKDIIEISVLVEAGSNLKLIDHENDSQWVGHISTKNNRRTARVTLIDRKEFVNLCQQVQPGVEIPKILLGV